MRLFLSLMLTACVSWAGTVQASDLEKEQRWADQVVDSLLDGEAVYLNDGQTDFLALETASAVDGSRKAAVVMHGTGVHPNWPTVVLPLRVALTETGWHTLSIQMPVLANEAEHAEYAAVYDRVPGRIDAAVDHLRKQGFTSVVLIAHSQGSTMAVYYLGGEHRPVDGLVAIGMSGGIPGGPMDNLSRLPRLNLPLLDLYGGEDLPEVMKSASQRAERAAEAGGDYTQRRVDGADHFFEGEEDELIAEVNAWLDARF
jgi:pimeloyl-ACP methyl ester carboxylesterase